MLPGALLRNERLKYVCKTVELEVTNAQTRFTAGYAGRRQVAMTVGNGEGNFFADEPTLDRLEGEGQVVFRYLDNPNGSARGIAGIVNRQRQCAGPDAPPRPRLRSRAGLRRRRHPLPERAGQRLRRVGVHKTCPRATRTTRARSTGLRLCTTGLRSCGSCGRGQFDALALSAEAIFLLAAGRDRFYGPKGFRA